MLNLLGNLGSEFRRRLTSHQFLEEHPIFIRQVYKLPTSTSFLSPGIADCMKHLVECNRDQQPPEIVAVGDLRIATIFDPTAKTMKSAECHVFFVGGAAGCRLH